MSVADGCQANLSNLEIQNSTIIGPPPETMIGNVRIWVLRGYKEVVIPEGTKRIGNHWFWGSKIESIEIPVSVREIGADAFFKCKNLNSVIFA